MEVVGDRGFVAPDVELAAGFVSRWRGLMGRESVPLLMRTKSVHGFWLREPVWAVGLDVERTVGPISLLVPRRVVWFGDSHWILELPQRHALPGRGERLAFR